MNAEAATTAYTPIRGKSWWQYKIRAALISMSISACFIFVLTTVLLMWLYPKWFLFRYDGGWQGLRIVMAVDLVLGPVIAFVIFNINKSRRELLLDISIVATIQFSAFAWGCYALWQQHPLALVYHDNEFRTITRADLKQQKVTSAILKPYLNIPIPLIFSHSPQTHDEVGDELVDAFNGIEPYARIASYRPFKEHLAEIFIAQPARQQALKNVDPLRLSEKLIRLNLLEKDMALAPAILRNGEAVLLFNTSGTLLDAIDVPEGFTKTLAETSKSKS